MIIKSLHVSNFRSLRDAAIDCDPLTVLVGRNGSGKSAFLKALELFYSPSAHCDPEEYYAMDGIADVEVFITFTDLDDEELAQFAKYLEEGNLTVARVFSQIAPEKSGRYFGYSMQNPDFATVRTINTAGPAKAAYDVLRQTTYPELPAVRSRDAAVEALEQWESAHPGTLVRMRDDGQFFGFKEVARGYLGRNTRFIFIPAMRDAAQDAAEGKGSVITELMDLVVRSALSSREEFEAFKATVQERYDALIDPSKIAELTTLETRLTSTLRDYVPDAAVQLAWQKGNDISLPLPKASVRLLEDDYAATVDRTGHGLQRAFILTILQHLAIEQAERGTGEEGSPRPGPNLIFGVEEPELFQHPGRQRHFAEVLHSLTSREIPGVATRAQVIYCTHSPLFVGLDRFDQIRLLRKVQVEAARPKASEVVISKLDDVAHLLWEADGGDGDAFTAATLRPRLQAVMTPWVNEGFFADVAILVEGEDDRAAISAMARHLDLNLEAHGCALIPCGGKQNVATVTAILTSFGIPTYCLWDGDADLGETLGTCSECGRPRDKKSDPKDNRRLLRLMGRDVEDWPAYVGETSACFDANLETTLRTEIGANLFDTLLHQAQAAFGYTKRHHALKNPFVIQSVIRTAAQQGAQCPTLESIVSNIIAMR